VVGSDLSGGGHQHLADLWVSNGFKHGKLGWQGKAQPAKPVRC
jgi:hypothetical protein